MLPKDIQECNHYCAYMYKNYNNCILLSINTCTNAFVQVMYCIALLVFSSKLYPHAMLCFLTPWFGLQNH